METLNIKHGTSFKARDIYISQDGENFHKLGHLSELGEITHEPDMYGLDYGYPRAAVRAIKSQTVTMSVKVTETDPDVMRLFYGDLPKPEPRTIYVLGTKDRYSNTYTGNKIRAIRTDEGALEIRDEKNSTIASHAAGTWANYEVEKAA